MVLPFTLPPQASMIFVAMCFLRESLMATTVSTISQRGARFLRRAHQRQRVLGEARAAVTGARVQKLAADAPVEPDAARDIVHVRAHLLAEIGDLVDEGDLGREERVGRVLDQLRAVSSEVNTIGVSIRYSGR